MTDASEPRPSGAAPVVSDTRTVARAVVYSPDLDGEADPGEIVWTWVPFEEDHTRGKDRPVLVVGRDPRDREPDHLLGLMLSSKPYHADDPEWLPIGVGTWDDENRPSFVRLDRTLLVVADRIRREGAILDRQRFDAVARELRAHYGWS
ncbi:type II toxin-antitoxin system PemK/MazF family toxin [Gordonia sp. X0973]|uniref:type II toxin-antitoxin system PemK/MazF family toxin n=1 Tax=Gordonia sp. X0973 TaxID=2742602 RepID=UPI000F548E3C|nr:type II toxin-antitoxin system PemK/MazF family toxin [Gordonia sp. X0973]QKT07742.1 type II toxin-antitoxin system PemK/MazF family toxin [Gordonia sp. X0973]